MKHQATPYFTFNGQAREALDYYKEVFDGEITNLQTFGDADFDTPPEMEDRIMHARLQNGNFLFMVSDNFGNHEVQTGSNISLALELESPEEIERYYNRLKENGKIIMELQDTFWGATFAKVKDAYDITWDLNFEKPQT
ncbi:VOC family protein [Halobacillus locisalis]|uniref:VOC family protein n=1 Tax=Halobacillus locisalis TaxID=220753 RepID=A0A838CUT5_9BACI|nr:VOC family protein [Halobacillus locisalis]MBA2175691.1 VOC family protein [Halobacillus locisalis]